MFRRLTSFLFKIVEPLVSLLDQVGLKNATKNFLKQFWVWLVGSVSTGVATIYGMWIWIWDKTPDWAIPFLVLVILIVTAGVIFFVTYLPLKLVEQWYATRSRLTLDTSKYREIGNQLTQFSSDVSIALRDWERDYPRRIHRLGEDVDTSSIWEKEQNNRREIESRFRDRFADRFLYLLNCFMVLRIKVPIHFTHMPSNRPD